MNKIIITNTENVITTICDTAEVVENGLLITEGTNAYIIGCVSQCNVYTDIELPTDVCINKYTYTTNDGVQLNTTYSPTPEETILGLVSKVDQLEADNANMTYALMMGGLL